MSVFPESFDSPEDLYVAYDSVRATLSRDYQPGDSGIFVEGDVSKFPPKGIVTLGDNTGKNSISLEYKRKQGNIFLDLTPAEGSVLAFKPKKTTNVVMQLRAEYHNAIADSLMSIQQYLGLKNNIDKNPNGTTLIGRINFIRNLIYAPKAWFDVDKTFGVAPCTVTFTDKSRGSTGPVGNVSYEWDFGDGTRAGTTRTTFEKVYDHPGVYDVSMSIKNSFGEDKLVLKKLISIRATIPNEAKIKIIPQKGQELKENRLRTQANKNIILEVLDSGELLDDPVAKHTWKLADELSHNNSPRTEASFAMGGLHDIVLRVDTKSGSYRITTIPNAIDVVETNNIWLWNLDKNSITAYEFGVFSETFISVYIICDPLF